MQIERRYSFFDYCHEVDHEFLCPRFALTNSVYNLLTDLLKFTILIFKAERIQYIFLDFFFKL